MGEQARQRDDGIRKLCGCAGRSWAKCSHPWHFDYKWAGERYRFTLDRRVGRLVKDDKGRWKRDRGTLGEQITSNTEADHERDRLRTAIPPAPSSKIQTHGRSARR